MRLWLVFSVTCIPPMDLSYTLFGVILILSYLLLLSYPIHMYTANVLKVHLFSVLLPLPHLLLLFIMYIHTYIHIYIYIYIYRERERERERERDLC